MLQGAAPAGACWLNLRGASTATEAACAHNNADRFSATREPVCLNHLILRQVYNRRPRAGIMSPAGPPRLNENMPLSDYPYVAVRFRCHVCERSGDARLTVSARKYGAGRADRRPAVHRRRGMPSGSVELGTKAAKCGIRCAAISPISTPVVHSTCRHP